MPAPKRRRISMDEDDIQIVDLRPGKAIELEENSPNSIQHARRNMDDNNFVFMPIEDIPGPSHAFHVRNEDNEEVKPIARVNREFSQRRQEIMGNLQASLTKMEDDYNRIAQLTETLHNDRQTKTSVKQKVDKLAAEIAEKSAQIEILDKDLEKLSKRIETNEKTLEIEQKRIKSFEVNYKDKEEAGGKVGEYECPICREICGNEQKQMVCITTCGHRFCKDCVDRILAPNEQDLRRRGVYFRRLVDGANLQPRYPRQQVYQRAGAAIRELVLQENENAVDDAANPNLRARAPQAQAPVFRPGRDIVLRQEQNDNDNYLLDLVNNQRKRRCPTCQKHFSKKNVIRLY